MARIFRQAQCGTDIPVSFLFGNPLLQENVFVVLAQVQSDAYHNNAVKECLFDCQNALMSQISRKPFVLAWNGLATHKNIDWLHMFALFEIVYTTYLRACTISGAPVLDKQSFQHHWTQ
jgi:hypothetical protein